MAALQPTPTVVVCLLSVLHHTPFFGVQQGRWGAIHVLECRKVGGPSASTQRTERECIYIHLHRRLLERSEFRAVWNQEVPIAPPASARRLSALSAQPVSAGDCGRVC